MGIGFDRVEGSFGSMASLDYDNDGEDMEERVCYLVVILILGDGLAVSKGGWGVGFEEGRYITAVGWLRP